MKYLVLFLPLFWTAQAEYSAASEGDCADCNNYLSADTGVGSGNMAAMTGIARAIAKAKPSFVEQAAMCQDFVNKNFSGLKERAESLGYSLYEIYDEVKCDSTTNADLIKHRASLPTARSDIMSLARYYIRDNNDPAKLASIFNTVIDNPGKPSGTLLDFIDFYSKNPNLSTSDKEEFAAYEEVIKRFGGKRESEL